MTPSEQAARNLAEIGHNLGRTVANIVVMAPCNLVRQMFNPGHPIQWIKSRHEQRMDARIQAGRGATRAQETARWNQAMSQQAQQAQNMPQQHEAKRLNPEEISWAVTAPIKHALETLQASIEDREGDPSVADLKAALDSKRTDREDVRDLLGVYKAAGRYTDASNGAMVDDAVTKACAAFRNAASQIVVNPVRA